MRTGQEIADWIADLLAYIYSRPEQYANSQGLLDGQLQMLHYVWCFATDQEMRFHHHPRFGHPDGSARRWDGFHDQIDDFTALQSALDVIVCAWREFDAQLGLKLPDKPQ